MVSQDHLEHAKNLGVISPASESLAHSALGLDCTWQNRTPLCTRARAQNQATWVTPLVYLQNVM